MNGNLLSLSFILACLLTLIVGNTDAFCFERRNTELKRREIEVLESDAQRDAKKWDKSSIGNALDNYLRAAHAWIEIGVPEKSTECYRRASKLHIMLSEKGAALVVLKKALEIAKRSRSRSEEANTLSKLAVLEFENGSTKNSAIYLNKAVALIDGRVDAATKADVFLNAGEVHFYRKELKPALEFFLKSLELYQNNQDSEGEAQALLFIGYVQLEQDNFSEVIRYFQESIKKWERVGSHRGLAISYAGLGLAYNLTNKKQSALDHYKKSEMFFPNGIDYFDQAIVANGLGSIYEEYGELELSLNYRTKALAFYEKANNQVGRLATFPSLIKINFLLGNAKLALEQANQAQEIAHSLSADYYLATIRKDLGNYYSKIDKEKAFVYFEEALRYFRKNGFQRESAFVLSKLGQINAMQNASEKAKENFSNSLTLSQKVLDDVTRSDTSFQLAKLYQLGGDRENAIGMANQSLNLSESLYSDLANANLKRTYFSNIYDRYELYINLLMQKHNNSPTENFAIQALQASEKSRSRSLLETLRLSEANFTKDANPQTVQKEKETRNLLSLKTDKLTELLSGNSVKAEIDKVDEERRTLEHELETIKADLKQQSPIYSAIKNPPSFDHTEFQQNVLDEKTVLLEFAFGEKESYLWLIGKTEISSFVLPSRSTLENRIDKIRQAFENRQILDGEDAEIYQKRIADLENASNLEANLLSNELLGQVIDKIADKRLIVVPDGKLALLPLSALPYPNSVEMLVAKNEIVYQPSASLLNILPNIQTHKQLPTKDLLVFADPVFDNSDNRLTAKNENESFLPTILGLNLRDFRLMDENGKIPRLFATQAEADSIAETVGKSRTEIASGFAANREKVLNPSIADYRILHFATHGLVDVNRPEVSSIVLSQFDENGEKREGFLRLQDIYSLDLATDLVVLSACQSGIGKEIKGEGLMSLNNAFLQAGAKSVVSSAWKVDDEATAEFMKRFYTNLISKGLTTSESLRQTQIEMATLTQYKSPFYWAAFTVQGQFRQPISVSRSYFYPMIFVLAAILGIGLFWKFRRYTLTNVCVSA